MTSTHSIPLCALTILQCAENAIATKTWRADGSVGDYGAGYLFRFQTGDVGNLDVAEKLLKWLETQTGCHLIYGLPRSSYAKTLATVGEFSASAVRRRSIDGTFAREWARIIILDLDNIPALPGLTIEENAREARDKLLPEAFRGVACIVQVSASTGHPSKNGRIGLHLVFIADEAFELQRMRDGLRKWSGGAEARTALAAWCERAGTTLAAVERKPDGEKRLVGLDYRTLQPVQAIFTAAPVVEAGAPADPYAGRRVFRLGGLWTVDASELLAKPREHVSQGAFAPTPNVSETDDDRLVAGFIVDARCYGRGAPGFDGAPVTREQWLAFPRNMRELGFASDTVWEVWNAIYEGDNFDSDTREAANWAEHRGAIGKGTLVGIIRQAASAARRADVLHAVAHLDAGISAGIEMARGYPATVDGAPINVANPLVQTAADAKRARLAALREKARLTPSDHAAKVKKPRLGRDSVEPLLPTPTLVDGIIPEVGVTAISGSSGAGKTLTVSHLAVCLALQRRFFGVETRERVGTLIIAGERLAQLPGRVQAARKQVGATKLPIMWVKPSAGLEKLEGWEDLAEDVGEAAREMREGFGVRLGVVVVDTLGASTELRNENDGSEVAAAMRTFGDVAEALGISIIVVMHFGKDDERGIRGSSAFRAGFDYHLQTMCQRDPKTGEVSNRRIYIEKNTTGPEGELLGKFDVVGVPMGSDVKGKPWTVGALVETATRCSAVTSEGGAFADGEATREAVNERMERETGAQKDRLLKAMRANPSASPTTTLADELGLDKSKVSRFLSEMERNKLVKKLNNKWVVSPTGERYLVTVGNLEGRELV